MSKIDKQELFRAIDGAGEEIIRRGRALFDCPEPGFQERGTEAIICRCLDGWGVPYEKDVALTGVVARLGQGGRHVAVVADMDALPRKGGGCIHSCGHSIQVNDALAALYALLPCHRAGGLGGRVTFFFTPAEELTDPAGREALLSSGAVLGRSGKLDMIARGLFDGVDCAVSLHAASYEGRKFDINTTLTGFLTKRAVFHGRAAHSGAMPHQGRNALHGAVLAETALGFLKDQFPPEGCVRVFPVIQNVSGGVNIIPDEAALETYVRAADREILQDASKKFDDCVHGCAAALGLTVKVETRPGYLPLVQCREMGRIAAENMALFVDWEDILEGGVSGASGDIGDVGSLVPTIQFGFSGVSGAFHSDDFSVRDEEFCYLTVSKVLAATVSDLLSHPIALKRN